MRIAIAGGTGVLGRAVASRLRAMGHELRLLTRAQPAGPPGPEAVAGDLLQPQSLRPWLRGCDVALHLATALRPLPGGAIDWAANDRVRTLGTAHLLQACARERVSRIVVQSVAFVRSPAASHWCEGDEPLADLPFLASAAAMERLVSESGLDALVLRGGLFYGPGTTTSARWEAAAAAGSWSVPANRDDYVSLVHVADMASAVCAAAAGGAPAVLAVVDDEPVRWGELVHGLCALTGAAVLAEAGPPSAVPSFRVSNRGAREQLGWKPKYSTWRDGLRHDAGSR